VLAADTPLVILDEPTANLDPTIRSKLLALIREARSAGRTVMFSSHVLAETEQVCDRVAILRSGRLVHLERMGELLRQHRITGRLTDPGHDLSEGRPPGLKVHAGSDRRLEVLAPGELRPVLGWLATLPVEEIRIEPVRLQAVYDRFHPPEAE
jgi:ABC-2 type transport system ATP-binding protein